MCVCVFASDPAPIKINGIMCPFKQVVKVSDHCLLSDLEGSVCFGDNTPEEAYCSFDLGATACARCGICVLPACTYVYVCVYVYVSAYAYACKWTCTRMYSGCIHAVIEAPGVCMRICACVVCVCACMCLVMVQVTLISLVCVCVFARARACVFVFMCVCLQSLLTQDTSARASDTRTCSQTSCF